MPQDGADFQKFKFKLRAGNFWASLPSMPAEESGFQKRLNTENFKFCHKMALIFKFKLKAGNWETWVSLPSMPAKRSGFQKRLDAENSSFCQKMALIFGIFEIQT